MRASCAHAYNSNVIFRTSGYLCSYFQGFIYLTVSDDDHRVKLEKLQDDEFSDYINASYVDVSFLRSYALFSIILFQ